MQGEFGNVNLSPTVPLQNLKWLKQEIRWLVNTCHLIVLV